MVWLLEVISSVWSCTGSDCLDLILLARVAFLEVRLEREVDGFACLVASAAGGISSASNLMAYLKKVGCHDNRNIVGMIKVVDWLQMVRQF